MPESGREAIERGYAALNDGHVSAVLDLIEPDGFVWEEGERSLGAGIHHGRDTFVEFVRSWTETFDDFRIELLDVLEEGDELVVIGHQSGRGRASGLPVEIEVAHVWTVRDGRAVRWRSFGSRAAALAAIR
jgi:ketosteroid isomerase-like protein